MRLLVSCVDSGSLKEVVCDVGTDTSKKTEKQPLSVTTSLAEGLQASIETMCTCDRYRVLVGRSNGALEMVKITEIPHVEEAAVSKDAVVPAPAFEISQFEVLGSVQGLLDHSKLAPLYERSKKRVKLKDGFVTISKLPGLSDTYLAATRSGLISIVEWDDESSKLSKVTTLEVKAPLEFAQIYDLDQDATSGDFVFAYGGEENLIKLVQLKRDFSSLTQIWEAKNVKNDRLDLRVPVWPIALRFLKPFESSEVDKTKPNYQFVVITHWSHLGLYRTQHGRRPLEYKDLLPNREPLVQMQLVGEHVSVLGNIGSNDFRDFQFVTADTKHNVYKFELNGQLRMKYGKSDITGAPCFLGVHNQKYLLEGGLDRYARVFDLESGSKLAKVYTGSKVNFVQMLDDGAINIDEQKVSKSSKRKREPEDELAAEAENDELWKHLDKSKNKSSKKSGR